MANDPMSWLTKWLTDGGTNPDEKTRVVSREQKEWYLMCELLASDKGLNMPFYKEMVEIDMRIMMAYEGKRSDDVVIALTTMEQLEDENVGIQPLVDALKAARENRGRQ